MNAVDTVLAVLTEHNFERRPRPLEVANTKFEFDGAAVGKRPSHDLVLVAGDDIPSGRLVRMVTSVARNLDIAESKRPITLVLVGGIGRPEAPELERVARVLRVSDDPTSADVENALAVLLPLDRTFGTASRGLDPLEEMRAHAKTWRPEWDAFVTAARVGQHAVEEELARFVNEGANPSGPSGGDYA